MKVEKQKDNVRTLFRIKMSSLSKDLKINSLNFYNSIAQQLIVNRHTVHLSGIVKQTFIAEV